MAQNSKGLRYTYADRKKHIIDHIGSEDYDPVKMAKHKTHKVATNKSFNNTTSCTCRHARSRGVSSSSDRIGNNYNSAAYRTGVWTRGDKRQGKKRKDQRKERKKQNPTH